MHQKPSRCRAPPGPAGELERSPDPLAVLGGGMGPQGVGEGGIGKEEKGSRGGEAGEWKQGRGRREKRRGWKGR